MEHGASPQQREGTGGRGAGRSAAILSSNFSTSIILSSQSTLPSPFFIASLLPVTTLFLTDRIWMRGAAQASAWGCNSRAVFGDPDRTSNVLLNDTDGQRHGEYQQ
ncbi:hypothetical protein E1301_Tti018853 [Triplophysa tibetana]|uniref:Uncharacterized protein n=1 Tax=Triplophysa tibetana TaxID=1572043 RepID=A0A5A9NM57_9TELE|nr:hypothetical protein E1301_Tti018853 [Triplophysa tibetana]